jgi:Bromodomain
MRGLIDMSIGMSRHSKCGVRYQLYPHVDRSSQADVTLVIENAMRYNKPGTPYYKAAQRIKLNSATVLMELDNLRTSAPSKVVSDNGRMDSSQLQRDTSTIGDLEPPLGLLDLLVSLDIADELTIILRSDPLQFLLAYELPEAKPLPMAPVQSALPPRKKKRERKAELGKRCTEQRAALVAQSIVAAEADSEMGDASFGSHPFPPTSFPAKFAASVDTNQTATTTTAGSEVEYGSEAEQILGKRKRAKPAHSHPGMDAEVLTDINPKASFALFDKGWILDPGVRRGGRGRVERLPPPPTKKRPKGACVSRNRIVYNELTRPIRTNVSRQGRYTSNSNDGA